MEEAKTDVAPEEVVETPKEVKEEAPVEPTEEEVAAKKEAVEAEEAKEEEEVKEEEPAPEQSPA